MGSHCQAPRSGSGRRRLITAAGSSAVQPAVTTEKSAAAVRTRACPLCGAFVKESSLFVDKRWCAVALTLAGDLELPIGVDFPMFPCNQSVKVHALAGGLPPCAQTAMHALMQLLLIHRPETSRPGLRGVMMPVGYSAEHSKMVPATEFFLDRIPALL